MFPDRILEPFKNKPNKPQQYEVSSSSAVLKNMFRNKREIRLVRAIKKPSEETIQNVRYMRMIKKIFTWLGIGAAILMIIVAASVATGFLSKGNIWLMFTLGAIAGCFFFGSSMITLDSEDERRVWEYEQISEKFLNAFLGGNKQLLKKDDESLRACVRSKITHAACLMLEGDERDRRLHLDDMETLACIAANHGVIGMVVVNDGSYIMSAIEDARKKVAAKEQEKAGG